MAADLSYQQIVMHRRDGNLYIPSGKSANSEAGGYFLHSVAAVAATGSVIGDAAALTAEINVVSAADDTVGVILPVAQAGMIIYVKSTVANKILKVWPQSGGTINALTASNAMSLASGPTIAAFIATSTTQWYSLPLLPS